MPLSHTTRAAHGSTLLVLLFSLTVDARANESAVPKGPLATGEHSASVIPLDAWEHPPRAALPIARWWWPGGSVEPATLERELRRIRDAGFGAVEIQPLLLGLAEEDVQADPRLRSVGTPDFQESLAIAAALASDIGLGFAFTLSSGWPGGLPTESRNAERQLLLSSFDVEGPNRIRRALPTAPDQSYRSAVEWVLDVLGPPDPDVDLVAVLAGRLNGERDGLPLLDEVHVISASVTDGRLD